MCYCPAVAFGRAACRGPGLLTSPNILWRLPSPDLHTLLGTYSNSLFPFTLRLLSAEGRGRRERRRAAKPAIDLYMALHLVPRG